MTHDFYILKRGFDKKDNRWYLGRARMFFINNFTLHEQLSIEYDVNIDAEQIKVSLSKFQIKVDDPIINPTAAEMIQYFKDDIDYFGCSIIFIFSHGKQDYIYCSDFDEESGNGKINVWSDYYQYFSGEFKPKLKDCPKVFFNEWCQELGNETNKDLKNQISVNCQSTAHWLIYNAAQPMYQAYGSTEKGSYSTQAFCRLLQLHGETKDLDYILRMVKQTDFKTEVNDNTYLQPISYSSLVKKLYLLPEGKIYQLMSIYRKQFEHVAVLGVGQFGVVFQARHLTENRMYAIKRIQVIEGTEAEQKRIKREIEILSSLNCPHIVRYYRSWDECAEFDCQKQEDIDRKIIEPHKPSSKIMRFSFIQMELCCHETLEGFLKKHINPEKRVSLNIFKQIIKGLVFLHGNSVLHRDVKPPNILFALSNTVFNTRVCIADFGLAKLIGDSSSSTAVGTSLYIAPEVVMLNGCNEKSDMYSVGLILMELLYNCSGEHHDEILLAARHGEFAEAFYNELRFAFPMLKKLLSFDSRERPRSVDLLRTLRKDPDWKHDLNSTISTLPQINLNFQQQPQENVQFESICTGEEHKVNEVVPENVQFESICTSEEHRVNEVSQWSTSTTLVWNGGSEYFPLPTAAAFNTRWMVQFWSSQNNDFGVTLHCHFLDAKFCAASIRLFAVVEGYPHVWTETANVLKSGERYGCCFSKKISELPKARMFRMHVSAHWTEIDQLQYPPNLWDVGTAHILCRWRLEKWKTVTPTVDGWWCLFSEVFGQRGALWRIYVANKLSGSCRQLEIVVMLQHLPKSVNWSELSWKCSLSLWNRQFDEQNKAMKKDSCCSWNVIDNVKTELRNPLDLNVMIIVNKAYRL